MTQKWINLIVIINLILTIFMVREIKKPNIDEDLPLPEIVSWNNLANKPRSIKEIDDDVGELAFHNKITETLIEDDAITTPKIAANAITAGKINVDKLSAITADLGTINAGTINGVYINGSTIQTTTDDNKIVLDEDGMKVYADGELSIEIFEDTIRMYHVPGRSSGIEGDGNLLLLAQQQLHLSADDGISLFSDTSILNKEFYVQGDQIRLNNASINFSGDGLLKLPQMTDSGDAGTSEPDGSMYYNKNSDRIRVKLGGRWYSLATTDDLP